MTSPKGLRLLVTVTFKPNQLRAHLEPILALEEVEAVKLVADEPAPQLPKLTTVVPPKWLRRLCGRAGAKFLVCLLVARRERPNWIIGYHLLPHGITAALVARLTQGKAMYHQIGGPAEWQGGGWRSDNAVLGRLRRPVPALEALLVWIIKGCTIVAAMGERGREALVGRGIQANRVVVIPPAIDVQRFRHSGDQRQPDYDLVTVCDLIEVKRVRDLLEAISRLRPTHPGLRAAIVGTGPLEAELKAQARQLGIGELIDFLGFRHDVEEVLARSGVFVLASRSEGLSVALSEAMASGLPAVVSDVGELRSLVSEGRNGYLYPAGDVERLAERLAKLIDDSDHRLALGRAAAADVRALAGVDRISEIYRRVLTTAT